MIPSIRKRIEGLDELRGIAAIAVVIFHAEWLFPDIKKYAFGYFAVDLFLIISGFLIGKILLDARGEPNFFRRFYIRRIFRILPLAIVAILTGILLSLLFNRSLNQLPFYILFIQNFIPEGMVPLPGCDPLWSLAVEEHFYLLLPLVIFIFPSQKIPWVLLSIMSLCIILKVEGTQSIGGWYTNPKETWMRMPYLLMGVLLNFEQKRTLYSLFFLVWIAVLAFFGFPIIGIEILIAIGLLLTVVGAISGRFVLKNRFLAFSGKICFGLYVIHYFVRIPFDNLGWDYSELSFLLKNMVLMVYMAISYLLAVASFYWFEMPIQRFRTRFEESKN